MKKFAAILLGLVIVVGLVGCGGSKGGTATTAAQGGGNEGAAEVKGEVVNVGDFEVFVPDGWMKSPQEDIFSDPDADGNYPILTDSYGMVKGGKDEWDALSKPCVYVYYYPDFDAKTQYESNLLWYDEPTDIDVTVNGVKCLAFEAESLGYIYQVVFYPVTDTTCFQFNIPKDLDGTAGVTVDDEDVKAIMASVKVK